MCPKNVVSTAAPASGCCARQARLDYAATPLNVRRLLLTVLMSFVLLAALQLPQPARAAVVRIPTGIDHILQTADTSPAKRSWFGFGRSTRYCCTAWVCKLIPLQTVRYRILLKRRWDRIDYTVVCFMMHDCSRELWKLYHCEMNEVQLRIPRLESEICYVD